MLWRIVAIEHPNTAFAPCYYVTAATPSTVAQFEPTVGVVGLYPSQLFGVQFAVAPSHGKIIDRPAVLFLRLERNTTLGFDIMRLCGFHKFGLRHPKPAEAATDCEQDGFNVSAFQFLRFSLICDKKHVSYTHLHFVAIIAVACGLLSIYDHILLCSLDKGGSNSIRG